ncbi:MAG: hypothetical protein QFX33_01065 [Candidatus Nezhaarchaeota archaeon]|nr:hypothetical protein [Candidatus Nezhaarchaeota archaeon]
MPRGLGINEEKASKRVSLIGVGSRVHPLHHQLSVFEWFLRAMESSGLEVNVLSEPVMSVEEAQTVRQRVLESQGHLFIAHLTGGTSKTAVEIAKWSSSPVTLLAHEGDNSLPSCLEAKTRLRALGLEVRAKLLSENGDWNLKGETESFEGCMTLLGSVSPRTFDVTCPATLAQRLKVKVKHVTYPELEKYMGMCKSDAELFSEFLSEFKGSLQVPRDELLKSLKLKEAVRSALEHSGCRTFTVDCFEFIKVLNVTPCLAMSFLAKEGILGVCECDVQAAACMMSLRDLVPPFMGNIASLKGERMVVAHCTAPITLAGDATKVKLKSHFETGSSVSIDVPLRLGGAVLASCDPQLRRAYVLECYVSGVQLESDKLCRTQVLLDVKSKASIILERWPSGHAVLAVHLSVEEVKRSLRRRGFDVEEV